MIHLAAKNESLSFISQYGEIRTSFPPAVQFFISGEYKIRLADGRLQVVSYVANKYGFNPRITYVFDAETGPQLDFNATDARPKTPPAVTRGPGAQPILVDGFPDLDGLPLDEQEQLLLDRQRLLEQQFKQLQEQVSCCDDVIFRPRIYKL